MQEKQTRLEQRNVAYLSNKDNFICFLKAPLDEISLNDWSKAFHDDGKSTKGIFWMKLELVLGT